MEHRRHLLSTPWDIAKDLAATMAVHRNVLGGQPRFYRPTYGQLTLSTLVATRHFDAELVLWSGWGHEWSEHEVAPVVDRLEPSLEPGAILLLHDNDVMCPPGTGEITRAVLEPLSVELHRRGLRSLTLSEMVL
jgi:peptidoglycan/xylan/chitin deacetylase (PgdA/CDA1 family)